ncbi:porin [Saccharospirillum salsuginis]|uniref:Porin n=1 Tax=Saccharospirillum salsuginis TaxID=418750 RepID=A0A918K3I6_9GAMM|nr:porin [Saccharospirillum salsuginis]GGX47573.1 hypothetical protein GCM10007392_13030 [Saccharospirillum salsuginis]
MHTTRLMTAIAIASGLSATADARTTIYGVADGMVYVENTDPGASLELDADRSYFGFKGDTPITPEVTAVFDSRYYADIVDLNNGAFPFALQGHVGVQGDFGTLRLFGGPTPVSKTRSYYNLMEDEPTSHALILGGGMLTPNAFLPTGTGYNTGLNYTSNDLQGGLSFDGAILPAQNPDGDTGFSVAANVEQPSFRASAGFEVNGAAEDTQVFRLVGEYDLGEITLGGLLQMAGNSDQDLNGTSFLGFAKMPLDVTRWPTRLRVSGGYAQQENDADTIDETQTYFSAVHEIQFSNQVSSYSFGEVFLPEESEGNVTRFGGGLRIKF